MAQRLAKDLVLVKIDQDQMAGGQEVAGADTVPIVIAVRSVQLLLCVIGLDDEDQLVRVGRIGAVSIAVA